MEKNKTVSDLFERLTDLIGSLNFLYEASRTDYAMEPEYAFQIATQHVLKFEIQSLNEALQELASEFDGLTYRQIGPGL
jgi:hypothetical protein